MINFRDPDVQILLDAAAPRRRQSSASFGKSINSASNVLTIGGDLLSKPAPRWLSQPARLCFKCGCWRMRLGARLRLTLECFFS